MKEFKLDLTDDTEDTLDDLRAPVGWYLATVESVEEDNASGAVLVNYRITGPTFVGAKVDDRIFDPDNAVTEDKQPTLFRRMKHVAKRLGLIGKDDLGRETAVSFDKAVGKKLAIKLEERKYIDKRGDQKTAVGMGWLSMFPLDHQEIPVAERLRLGLPLLPGQTIDDPKEADKKKGAGKGKTTTPSSTAATPPAVNAAEFANL